jgi:hypothetical protein
VFALLELKLPVVKLNPLSISVPAVNVVVPVLTVVSASPNIVVPAVIVNAAIVLLLLVIVPVPTIVTLKLVNAPPLDNVNASKFNDVVPGSKAVVPKLNKPNQLPVVNVCTAVPLPVIVKLGEFADVPPVVPKVYVLVTDASALKLPRPVTVKPVAVAILNTVVAAVVCASTILPMLNAIARVFELLELNMPVVKLNPLSASVPVVNVVVLVAVNEKLSPKVVVIPVPLIVNEAKVVLVLLVIVPVPTIVGVKVVNVPPLDNVNPFKFNDVIPGSKAVVPKLNVLK